MIDEKQLKYLFENLINRLDYLEDRVLRDPNLSIEDAKGVRFMGEKARYEVRMIAQEYGVNLNE